MLVTPVQAAPRASQRVLQSGQVLCAYPARGVIVKQTSPPARTVLLMTGSITAADVVVAAAKKRSAMRAQVMQKDSRKGKAALKEERAWRLL